MWLSCDFVDTYRQEEIDDVIESALENGEGFIDNFARGTAHMFRLVREGEGERS